MHYHLCDVANGNLVNQVYIECNSAKLYPFEANRIFQRWSEAVSDIETLTGAEEITKVRHLGTAESVVPKKAICIKDDLKLVLVMSKDLKPNGFALYWMRLDNNARLSEYARLAESKLREIAHNYIHKKGVTHCTWEFLNFITNAKLNTDGITRVHQITQQPDVTVQLSHENLVQDHKVLITLTDENNETAGAYTVTLPETVDTPDKLDWYLYNRLRGTDLDGREYSEVMDRLSVPGSTDIPDIASIGKSRYFTILASEDIEIP